MQPASALPSNQPHQAYTREHSPDGATCTRNQTSDNSLLLIYRPRKAELAYSWLTYSARFIHISGHPSAAGRVQDRESSPAVDLLFTTVPRHQLKLDETYASSLILDHSFHYVTT